MSKIVYLFDEITGEFTGEYLAQQSPLEPDVYITPVYSTDLKPLKNEIGKFNRFDGDQWTLKDDTRGTWFKPDRSEVEVTELTEVIDPTWTRIKPQHTQEELELIAAAEAKRLKNLALSIITVTTSSGKVFDGNETARINMLSALQASEFLNQTQAGWKLADNSVELVTVSELKEALTLAIKRVGEIVTG
ncbi:MAG: hypothetical protein Q8M99_11915 [Methylotenera sp.]|nr:hypothetical protein [Methylotenera sp.]